LGAGRREQIVFVLTGVFMTYFEMISAGIGILALLISSAALFFNGVQVRQANKGTFASQQLERGNAVLHFTSRFFDLIQKGEPEKMLADHEWSYQFWSLHATEFYFFHHGILPSFIYTIWMIDLSKFYTGVEGEKVRQSHLNYLHSYSFHYQLMADFYNQIFEFAKTCGDETIRNRKVADFVTDWLKKNNLSSLS
jgi:hypothetical protein